MVSKLSYPLVGYDLLEPIPEIDPSKKPADLSDEDYWHIRPVVLNYELMSKVVRSVELCDEEIQEWIGHCLKYEQLAPSDPERVKCWSHARYLLQYFINYREEYHGELVV